MTPFEFWNPESGFFGGLLAGLFIIAVCACGVKLIRWAERDNKRIHKDAQKDAHL